MTLLTYGLNLIDEYVAVTRPLASSRISIAL
jgi:hypothetical protein